MKIKFGLIFVSGYLLGDFLRAWYISKELKKVEPLLIHALSDVLTKAVIENLSVEEVHNLMKEEVSFVNMVTKK